MPFALITAFRNATRALARWVWTREKTCMSSSAGNILIVREDPYLGVHREWGNLERLIRDFNVLLKSLGKDTIYPGVEVAQKNLDRSSPLLYF